MQQPQLEIIGTTHGDIVHRSDAPKNYSESERKGVLEIYPQYVQGMEDIRAGETVVVLFWFHKSDRNVLKVYPRGDRSKGLRGVFSTRSPARPNPIAISELEVYEVEGNCLKVRGLDVVDGTPIVDIKKKIS
ncbi:MAG: tRNA-Thr(GGU) m(6)t(6)A37 methyltransferase TsaA [Desulforhopalus sp.]|jgi:tRNA-Thr(GGU) m(6)t(6)A37 methyltransferase TsaA